MIPALSDDQGVVFNTVNKAMFAVDPAGPPAGVIAFQGFGFARAGKWVTATFLDQAVDLVRHRFAQPLPLHILVKGLGQKGNLHSRSIALSSSMVLTISGAPELYSAIA